MVEKALRLARQGSFPGMCPVEEALENLACAGVEKRGAVFTRREVVDFILDLLGYTSDLALHRWRILEPSFGEGDFLLVVVDRLAKAWRNQDRDARNAFEDLRDSVRAVELHRGSFAATRPKVVSLLARQGVATATAERLADVWLTRDDFLLASLPHEFDRVVGNPPYVRQELIPDALIAEYRARYATIYDRADLYVPFIERSLGLLAEGGQLGFICADRWMKNRYGGRLRRMVAESFRLRVYVDMVNTPAFRDDVIAYPAITVIGREKRGKTRIARRPEITAEALRNLARELLEDENPGGPVEELDCVAAGAEPWLLEGSEHLGLVRRLERDFPLLEDAGCKVGIGVATGADKAFIGPFEELDVEPERKIRLVMAADVQSGKVEWRGLGIVNPFAEGGGLVDLDRYPRLKRYLEARRHAIARRHVARKVPANWYRTVDRIYPSLATTPKLLIPDIKSEAHIVHEKGQFYPHHNLYFITSEDWNLKALQAVLRSGIAGLFVSAYSTQIRGGYLRFQAQYLRRIRLPLWKDVPAEIRTGLTAAIESGDDLVGMIASLYGLSAQERTAFALRRAG